MTVAKVVQRESYAGCAQRLDRAHQRLRVGRTFMLSQFNDKIAWIDPRVGEHAGQYGGCRPNQRVGAQVDEQGAILPLREPLREDDVDALQLE